MDIPMRQREREGAVNVKPRGYPRLTSALTEVSQLMFLLIYGFKVIPPSVKIKLREFIRYHFLKRFYRFHNVGRIAKCWYLATCQ